MGKLLVVRRPQRRGLLISQGMSKDNPGLLFALDGIDPGELDDLIRGILAKGGITDEATIQAIVEKAEKDAEVRLQVSEAKAKIRKLMQMRREGATLMQRGFRNWKEAFFPAVKQFKKAE